MNLNSKNRTIFIFRMTLESGKCWQHDNHSKFFIFSMCFKNFLINCSGYLVFLRNKKLVFDVDEFLSILDKFQISVQNWVLSLWFLQPQRPHRSTSKNLMILFFPFVFFGDYLIILIESNIIEVRTKAMIYDILGVEFVDEVLYFTDILEVSCVKLHFLFLLAIFAWISAHFINTRLILTKILYFFILQRKNSRKSFFILFLLTF